MRSRGDLETPPGSAWAKAGCSATLIAVALLGAVSTAQGQIRLQTSTRLASGEFSSRASVGARFTDPLVFVPPVPGFGVSTATATIL